MHYFLKGGLLKGKVTSNFKCTYCGKLGHTEDRCFQKLAKQQSKDHANLVGAISNEDEDDADTSTPIHALTAHIQDLSLDEEVYAPDNLDFVFLSVSKVLCLGSPPKMNANKSYVLSQ